MDRQFAGTDDQPLAKAQVRRLLEEQAAAAGDLGARLMALSVFDYAGAPVPASLLVHWIEIPALDGRGALVMDLRDTMTPADGILPPGQSLDFATTGPGPVLRHVHTGAAVLESGEEPLPSLGANYWLERPDGAGLVQFVFATPMVEFRESMLGLFDAIVAAVRWVPDVR